MPNANVVEIDACLNDCIAWCESNTNVEFVKHYQPLLTSARREFDRILKESDAHFVDWKREEIEDKLAWKHLAIELRTTQNSLRSINAVGYPDERVRYWDGEILTAAVTEMIEYLKERASAIENSAEMIEALERRLARAHGENDDEERTYDIYRRHATQRAQIFGAVTSLISKFRGSMRRHLGKHNEEYKSLRWPFAINSDRTVL